MRLKGSKKKMTLRKLKPRNEFTFVEGLSRLILQTKKPWLALHTMGPSGIWIHQGVQAGYIHTIMREPGKKLSLLRGKVSKISAEEIDNRLKPLRDEWQRDI